VAFSVAALIFSVAVSIEPIGCSTAFDLRTPSNISAVFCSQVSKPFFH
jgi:hypothetical protein